MKKFSLILMLLFSLPVILLAQTTTSSIGGSVKNTKGELLSGATVTVNNTSTGSVVNTTTDARGNFSVRNLRPGGPYTISATYVGYQQASESEVNLNLGENFNKDFVLTETGAELQTVIVTSASRPQTGAKGGTETNIGRDKMANLPTVGRNISDYLRFVPQAKVTGDGGISLAGQNNRYNSFYIDGAVNNDVFGLAASGTNGGQAGIPPVSIDAIDQFQVVLSPYDLSLGNFTGGAINAVTKSGTNDLKASVYGFYRDQNLSGKTPGVAKDKQVKLANFQNKTIGFRIGGPIVKNKIFFFVNGEVQRDQRPQPMTGSYGGSSGVDSVRLLADYIRSTYNYEPGGYIDNPEKIEANRLTAKLDFNLSDVHKLSTSYRFTDGFRNNVSRSSNNTINFYNNGYQMPNKTHSGSIELNSRFSNKYNNRLLITGTKVKDDRGAIGGNFPRVTINDGSGRIVFGTEEFSTGNLLTQDNYALFDAFNINTGKHTITLGTDNEISKSKNIFIRQNYGSYVFNSVGSFMRGENANTYNRSYSLLDPGKTGDESVNAAALFTTLRLAFFVMDEVKVNNNFSFTYGIRANGSDFLTTPRTDNFFNDSAISKISSVYDLKGARSGQASSPAWSLDPRVGFIYKLPEEKITFRGGVGMFTGRVPLVWPGGVYNNNGISIAGIARGNVEFRPDANNQYVASDFGINVPTPSGEINLISKDFKMNKVLRTSFGFDKNFGTSWKFSWEGIYTKNINEIDYKRVDIVAPSITLAGDDKRSIYPLSGAFPTQIGLRSNGTSPYTGVYLLSNTDGPKGYSLATTFSIDKAFRNNWALNANYSYGVSEVRNEGTSSQNSSQWRYMETVNGRNFLGRSRSDYDPGHRVNAYVSKKFSYLNDLMATTISMVYNGQSGNPYSYVLGRGFIRDYDNNETNDLMFVPTETQINNMAFASNTTGGVTYNQDQQRAMLNSYIDNDKYLSTRRGNYADRNGARLPFTNIIDLKIAQDFNVKLGQETVQLQLTYDIFNFTNFLNKDWGRTYFVSNDQAFPLEVSGVTVTGNTATPTYKFYPQANNRVYNISDGVFNSSRWSSQVGVRISLL